jgi:uncharacterized protein (DUF1778 family)
MATATIKQDRLDLRLPSEEKHLIAEAAALIGLPTSSFLVMHALAAARRVMETVKPIAVTRADYERILREDEPAPDARALTAAFRGLAKAERSGRIRNEPDSRP